MELQYSVKIVLLENLVEYYFLWEGGKLYLCEICDQNRL